MSHSHRDDDCGASVKYTGYIQSHLEKLKDKCDSLTACIEHLLLDANPLLVLKGEDISLVKTCGLVSKNDSHGYHTVSDKCTEQAREDIRNDIEHHLRDAVTEGTGWNRFNKCIQNSYGDKEQLSMVDKACRLAVKEKEICGRYTIHRKVESFFNEQIQHLKCTCESLKQGQEQGVPIAAIAGSVAGGALLLVLIAVLCFCFYKRRKSKKKKKAPNVIYLPAPNGDNVYQEVFDDRPYQTSAFSMPGSDNPPTLPTRYTAEPGKYEEPAYLEPIEVGSQKKRSFRPSLPKRGAPRSNPNYDTPPDAQKKPEEGVYFQPLPTPPDSPTEKNKGGYDKLMRPQEQRTPPEGYETVEEARSSMPLEEAPRPLIPVEDVKLGPVPAARTKKEDRETESHYFLLEEKRQSEKLQSDV